MKGFLISIVCIALSFFITSFALKKADETSFSLSTTENNVIDNDSTEEVAEESANTIGGDSSDLDFSDITADYDKWSAYEKENIDLYSEYIPVDTEGIEIEKKEFLEKLKTSHYIPVKLESAENIYQLYKLEDDSDEKIAKSVKVNSDIVYSYLLREDTPFPDFNFTDLYGQNYTSDNTKGKLLVIECWFIQCTTCIQEFPILNDLYDRYEDLEDVLFFSIAFDSKPKLLKLLTQKEFRYPVVHSQKEFLKNQLKIKQYPTHIIVDEYGNIKKMFNNADSLVTYLDNMINGDLMENEMM